MTKLTDTQSILLSAAAAREDGSLLPLPASITAPAGGTAKSLASLVAKGCIEERPVTDPALVHRSDDDGRYGLFITAAGLTAIGVEPEDGGAADPDSKGTAQPDQSVPTRPDAPAPERQTKAALVLALLRRPEGATLAELVAATGWLPHTTRAALTGLRKKGHTVEKSKRDGVTCYRVEPA